MSGFACLECGAVWPDRPTLAWHWATEGHGPQKVQQDAVDRAVLALEGPHAADRRLQRQFARAMTRANLEVIDGDGG